MHNRNPLTQLINRGTRPIIKTAVAATMLGTFATPALADPPADGTVIPVFCFRIMNIEQTDADTDRFRFEIEVLNWTDTPADDLAIAIAAESDVNFFNNSGTTISDFDDQGGSTVSGNQDIDNDWSVDPSNNTETAIHWDGGTAIPNIDLVDIAAGPPPLNFLQQIDAVNATGLFPNNDFNTGLPETIDNGNNVRGGFVFEVDDFQAGETLSFNWFLTNGGQPLGTADGAGNAFGFGNVNLTWIDDGDFPGPVFPGLGNTGFIGPRPGQGQDQNPQAPFVALLAPDAAIVPLAPSSTDDPDEPVPPAFFGIEIGAGITPPFMNPEDSEEICVPGGCPISGESVPEPETPPLALLGLATFMGLGSLLKGQRHKKLD
ncbi:MAG: hypothetical protein MK111_15475 [Crocosphaera sp.]|uniref:PEP-CTERM protein-sorting domain-containing protein n=3 Tax=Crocosphaera watsonii TaxID=263511 RepID=G5J9H7_CROWT|nr:MULTISPECIES: hypothetical protein [Crocosphaera]EHJ11167.1 hypothetical protein CWATWH0003_4093 [Crocosphaera watsonii WH 0003]MCH2246012.1 hypothetical protein [Crocosphaera sp.]CCQ57053.1 hypothetical protein CWATWH0005_391 [Crocosphaera watsonii WH 0005]